MYRARSNRIRQTCEAYGLPPNGNTNQNLNRYQQQWLKYSERLEKVVDIDFYPLMVSLDPALCYCWTRKVASTSWQMMFYNLAGKKV
jgi:hypothetical protein